MPIRRRNGAWSRRRSTPRSSRKASSGERVIAGEGFLRRHHGDRACARTSCWPRCACRCCRRHPVRLQRIQPPRRRFRDGAWRWSLIGLTDGKIAEARVGVGGAEAVAAAHCGGRSRAGRPSRRATRRSAPRPKQRPTRSIRWRIIQADAEYRRDLVRAVVRRALERAAAMSGARPKASGTELGRPRDPAAGGSGAGARARPLHRRPAGGALGALRAQPGCCADRIESIKRAGRRHGDHRRRPRGRQADHADAAQVQLRAGRPADPRRRRRALRRRAGRRRGRRERGRGRGHRRPGRGRDRRDAGRWSMRATRSPTARRAIHAEAPGNVIVEGRVETPDFDDSVATARRTHRQLDGALAPAERDADGGARRRTPPTIPRPAA